MTVKGRMPTALGYVLATVLGSAVFAQPAQAQRITIAAGYPPCIPATAHALVTAEVAPPGPHASIRVYFRRHGDKDYYFVEMRRDNNYGLWAVLPKPECHTSKVDMYIAVTDPSGDVSRTEEQTVEARNDKKCQVTLTKEQWEYAQNIVVGETGPQQQDKAVLGFCCDGIVARLASDGVVRPDQVCRDQRLAQTSCSCSDPVVAAAPWKRILPWVAVGAVGGGGIVAINEDPKPECSPCRP